MLRSVDFSDNLLTGTLPYHAFKSNAMLQFAIVKNCVRAELSAEICTTAVNMSALVLDGMDSNVKCLRTPTLFGTASFTIPLCIFQLPVLDTLHLSGNLLRGALDANLAVSPGLQDLSLSHNRLSGPLPIPFYIRQWRNLDIGFNKFRGNCILGCIFICMIYLSSYNDY